MAVIDCPICSGKADRSQDEGFSSPHLRKDEYEKMHVCRNCGARITKDGKLFDSKGSEINMFGDTQDYG